MKYVEMVAAGFDGSTDETDNLVYWGAAESAAQIKDALDVAGVAYHSVDELPQDMMPSAPDDLEFVWPEDAARMVALFKTYALAAGVVK